MLTTALASHPDALVHDELFGADEALLDLERARQSAGDTPNQDLVALRDQDPSTFLRTVVLDAGGREVVGCKIKFEELLLVRYRPAVRDIVNDESIRIVFLTRANLLDRYLSEYRSTQVTGVFNVYSQKDIPPEHPVRLDRDACERSFSVTELRQRRFAELLGRHPTIDVSYEGLCADFSSTIEPVQDFLSLPIRPLAPTTHPLRSRSARDAIANYDELADYFSRGPYHRHFEESRS